MIKIFGPTNKFIGVTTFNMLSLIVATQSQSEISEDKKMPKGFPDCCMSVHLWTM